MFGAVSIISSESWVTFDTFQKCYENSPRAVLICATAYGRGRGHSPNILALSCPVISATPTFCPRTSEQSDSSESGVWATSQYQFA